MAEFDVLFNCKGTEIRGWVSTWSKLKVFLSMWWRHWPSCRFSHVSLRSASVPGAFILCVRGILAGYCTLHTLIPAFFSLPFEATLFLLSSSKLHPYFPPSLRSWLLPSPHSQTCFEGCLCAGHLNSSLNLCSHWAIKVRLWGFQQRWAAAVPRRHKPSFVSCKETNLSAQDTEAECCPELKRLIFKKQQTVVCS